MTKREFANIISDRLRVPKSAAQEKVDIIFECIYDVLASGESLTINGFGIFEVKQKAERNSHNPRTGETMTIPARMELKFRPCKQLKEDIRAIEIK